MDDLSSRILGADSVEQMDAIVEEAIRDVELIGELDIRQDAFKKIGEVMRRDCRRRNWHSYAAARSALTESENEPSDELLERNAAELERQGTAFMEHQDRKPAACSLFYFNGVQRALLEC